jgi:hypothetical protein
MAVQAGLDHFPARLPREMKRRETRTTRRRPYEGVGGQREMGVELAFAYRMQRWLPGAACIECRICSAAFGPMSPTQCNSRRDTWRSLEQDAERLVKLPDCECGENCTEIRGNGACAGRGLSQFRGVHRAEAGTERVRAELAERKRGSFSDGRPGKAERIPQGAGKRADDGEGQWCE